jgi:exopolysaccharide production protein ExoZ
MLKDKIISVQILRAMACLMVVQVHFFLNIPFINHYMCGAIGVDIFFIISGFIIAASIKTLPDNRPIATFFINRFSRVVPYYYFLTALFAILIYIFYKTYDTTQIVKSIFFIPQFKDPVIFLGWSLNHEIFFYTFVGLAMFVYQRNHLKIAAAFFILVTLAGLFKSQHYVLAFVSANINYSFLFGFLLFEYQAVVLKYFRHLPVLILSLTLLLIISIYTQDYPDLQVSNPFISSYQRDIIYIPFFKAYIPRFLIWGLPSFFVVTSFIAQESRFKPFAKSIFVKIGDASYSLYLLQLFPYEVMHKFNLNKTIWHVVLVVLLIIGGIAMLRIENLIGTSCKNYLKRKTGLISRT